MQLLKITEADIRDFADSDAIFERGKRYYRTGRIKSIKEDNGKIIARVIGNYGNYTIKIHLNGSIDDMDANCNCPYDGYGCKHIVAVLYKLMHEGVDGVNVNKWKRQRDSKENKLKNKISKIRWSRLNFQEIAGQYAPEKLLEAFDIVNNNEVKIKSENSYQVNAKVGLNSISVSLARYFARNTALMCRCSCQPYYFGDRCAHSLALLITVLKKHNPKAIPSNFELELRHKIRDERFKSLVDCLHITVNKDSDAQKIYEKNYEFFFNFQNKDRKLSISLEKATVLKSGNIGKYSSVSERFLKENMHALPEKMKRVCELFLLSLKENTYNYSSRNLIKENFHGEIDIELFKCLRALHEEMPDSLPNCYFPAEKGIVEILIKEKEKEKENEEGVYCLTIQAKICNMVLDLDKAMVFGSRQLWVYSANHRINNKTIIFELQSSNPSLVKQLINFAGTEIYSTHLDEFVKNHYIELSSLGNVVLPKNFEVEEKSIIPKPRLYLKDYQNTFSIELRFVYGAQEITYDKKHDLVFKEKNKIVKIKRGLEKEEECIKTVLENSVLRDDAIIPNEPLLWLVDVSKELISKGFEIYGHDKLFNHKIREEEPKLNIEVSSGIDWFDLKLEAECGDEAIPSEKMLEALMNHERFIKLSDGTIGVIPEKWLNKFAGVIGFLKKEKKQLKAAKTQIQIIEALLDISTKSKVDNKFKELQQKFKNFKEIQKMPLPSHLKGSLRDYQKAGYNWLHFLKEFGFGGCLADEMGLGKTVQVLSLLAYEKEHANNINNGMKNNDNIQSLVVVPTSLVFNWENEIKKFTPDLSFYVHHGLERKNDIDDIKDDLIITTYGTLRNDIEFFKNKKFYYAILDESQQIKNPLAKSTKSVYTIKSKYRLVLTGTPIENNSLDLWSQFAFLNPGLLGNMEYFKSTFTRSIDINKDKDKASALKHMINPFILMRKKETVAKELPDKQLTLLYCEMEDKQRKIYEYWKEKIKEDIKAAIEERGFNESKIKILQGLIKLRQICNHPKLIDESFIGSSGKFNLLIEQISEVISEGHKVLIYSSFVKMLHIFRDYFNESKIKFAYLDGTTKNRKEAVEMFQSNNDVSIFLISLKAGGLGLNLTAADYVFIVDPWWNPAAELQAIDRTHRIGQDKKIFIYKAITKDSVEEKILQLQESKLELVKNVITVEEGVFKKLSQEDINNMFR